MAAPHQPPVPTILVVEDEPSVREIMARFLEDVGFRVLTAQDGDAAWALLQEDRERVALIISDVSMPRMSGPELAERAEALPSPPRILLISGYPQRKLPQRYPFLPKPFRPDQFLAAVEHALGEKGRSSAPPKAVQR